MFDYTVVLKGLETIPLRTSKNGALGLIGSFFDGTSITPKEILEQVDAGGLFKTDFIQVSKVEKLPATEVDVTDIVVAKMAKLAKKSPAKKPSSTKKPTRTELLNKKMMAIRERLKGRTRG